MKREGAGSYIDEHKGTPFRVYLGSVSYRGRNGWWHRSPDWRAVISLPNHPQANKGGNVVLDGLGTKRYAEEIARRFIDRELAGSS